jgi:hypothetical protein
VLAMGTANRGYRSLIDALEPLQYPTIIVAREHAMAGPNALKPHCAKCRSGNRYARPLELCCSSEVRKMHTSIMRTYELTSPHSAP